MRGLLIAGVAVVLLIIGILVIKNMGADHSSGVSETQTQQYIQEAEDAADQAAARIKKIGEQVPKSD